MSSRWRGEGSGKITQNLNWREKGSIKTSRQLCFSLFINYVYKFLKKNFNFNTESSYFGGLRLVLGVPSLPSTPNLRLWSVLKLQYLVVRSKIKWVSISNTLLLFWNDTVNLAQGRESKGPSKSYQISHWNGEGGRVQIVKKKTF